MPTVPVKFGRGKYTDSDEAARRRARDISTLAGGYRKGGLYDDTASAKPSYTEGDLLSQATSDYYNLRRKPKVAYPTPKKK